MPGTTALPRSWPANRKIVHPISMPSDRILRMVIRIDQSRGGRTARGMPPS